VARGLIVNGVTRGITTEEVPVLVAAGRKLGRIGVAQLATGRGDAVLRRHVEQRIDTVLYRSTVFYGAIRPGGERETGS
jgi:hypothetical protein